MRFNCHALMLPDPDRARVSPDDPELARLIRAERIRMLFAATLPVAIFSALFALALSLVVAAQVGREKAMIWAGLSVLIAVLRVIHLSTYVGSRNRASVYWLKSLNLACGVHGLIWGLAGVFMPVQDLITTVVVVATLVGACCVCSFTLQADIKPNALMNVPILLPAALMLFTRQDAYGTFGGFGLLALLGLMMFESRRSERRITELLWLRFTTDRIARERAEALKLAQRHSAVKDQFLATMSHEMRTPLHGILGLARLVHNRLPAKPGVLADSRQQIELIERTGEHLLGIINDVLDFSRIEAGKLQISTSSFELLGVIHDVLSVLKITATEKGLKLRTTLDLPAPCWVKGDAARLRQVLHNLVGNAIKFTDSGEVRVTVSRQESGLVRFEIEDTGVGISPQHLPLIFEAFHQVDGSFGRKHKGTGLGLTISREIARAMGGDIVCASALDKGSTFTMTVPLPATQVEKVDLDLSDQQAAEIGPQAPPAIAAAANKGGHVLLAEDNPVNAIVAEATLANLGVQVTRVENGLEALAELERADHPYDVVLMDCQMPELDGIEATRRLRTWEHNHGRPPVPVVALTANAMNSDRERCLAAGMNEHLAKPFRQDELRTVLLRHLRAQRPQDTASAPL
ncbi:MAG TPA: ATP-binding protein [Aquabacterium sp.]|uniref:ATP-binding protein n=1 Tax=Aquabacterium sp. TaxID=1872578 RepID=UPI002E328BA0|nr:ATP-binding protein [Aquabacterium sp.]HEX5358139.1 ATP-binding protein [Aquabacterium sp.]